jgi:hypothetical protein
MTPEPRGMPFRSDGNQRPDPSMLGFFATPHHEVFDPSDESALYFYDAG